MSVIITNKPKLLDNLFKFNSYAGLFTNDIKQNEETPVFAEPSFTGYGLFVIDKSNWGPAVKEANYATTTYKTEIYWVNQDDASVTIRGYFLKSTNNQTLWFYVFNNPVTLSKNEGIYINPKVYLNNYDNLFNTFFIFNIKNPSPSLSNLNPSISITNELWGEVNAEKSLINIITGDLSYIPSNNCLVLALDPKIIPTQDLPFSFNIKSTQPGFYSAIKNIKIIGGGVYENTLYMIEAN